MSQCRQLPRLFPRGTKPSIDEFRELCRRLTSPTTYPRATAIQHNIPIYDLSTTANPSEALSRDLQDEWHHILYAGPGIVVLKGMYSPQRYGTILELTNAAFQRIVDRENAQSSKRGDHFAAAGSNDRIWNSFSKHALEDAHSFVEYYSNPWLALVCEAWLGPGYRVTAQMNAVKPGGAAQNPHRDYHLGFQDSNACARFPLATQIASQLLTLQGAVAHTNMPIDSGPTRFLPFSQLFESGYLAYRLKEFQDFFQEHYVALPLELGDAVFFNPALFHAAGANSTRDFSRKANLLQISSAFGKPMESIDTLPLVKHTWDVLTAKYGAEGLSTGVKAFISAIGEGYPFPTNLDNRPPAPNGMAPSSEQDVILQALKEGWDRERVVGELKKMRRDSAA
ncbi:hypothetical protein MAP00_002952 [Monascus purpureus]|nr:hypothetical protein MAP00_002952 [Monascus purpureus]